MLVEIWTDGACKVQTTKLGGWAYICKFDNFEFWNCSKLPDSTSNRAELTAIIEALRFIYNSNILGHDVIIYSDSKYCVNGITNWINNWRENNYGDGTIKNKDLWEKLYKLDKIVSPKYQWIRGHAGNGMNERVDKLATAITNV